MRSSQPAPRPELPRLLTGITVLLGITALCQSVAIWSLLRSEPAAASGGSARIERAARVPPPEGRRSPPDAPGAAATRPEKEESRGLVSPPMDPSTPPGLASPSPSSAPATPTGTPGEALDETAQAARIAERIWNGQDPWLEEHIKTKGLTNDQAVQLRGILATNIRRIARTSRPSEAPSHPESEEAERRLRSLQVLLGESQATELEAGLQDQWIAWFPPSTP